MSSVISSSSDNIDVFTGVGLLVGREEGAGGGDNTNIPQRHNPPLPPIPFAVDNDIGARLGHLPGLRRVRLPRR